MDRSELAEVLRTARARIRPDDVGLPAGLRRQVPGLRREEVAQLAGLSVDYVVRLEQGRGPRPSAQVLGALARALRLDDADRDLLFRLGGAQPPQAGRIAMLVRPSVLRLLDRMADLPAMVLSAKSDVLAWNPLAAALLGDFSAWPPDRRNILWQRFLSPTPRRVATIPDEAAAMAEHQVAALRSVRSRYPDDPDLSRLVDELRSGSAEFARLWREARSGAWHSTSKTVRHPDLGLLTFDCDTLLVPDADQSVIVYSAAPGTRAAAALDLLRTTAPQQLTEAR